MNDSVSNYCIIDLQNIFMCLDKGFDEAAACIKFIKTFLLVLCFYLTINVQQSIFLHLKVIVYNVSQS